MAYTSFIMVLILYLYKIKEFASYISLNPEIRFSKPCIINTRIAVSDIMQWLASGMTHEDILEDFPSLKGEHIGSTSFCGQPGGYDKNDSCLNKAAVQ